MTSRTESRAARVAGNLAGLLLAALGALGCSSTPAGPARAQRVAWRDYRSGIWLELVNETHTGRVEQYSETRKDASRKVQTDEIVGALIEVMLAEGFAEQARPGPAPRSGDDQAVMALEIEDGGRVEHVLAWRGMPAAQRLQVLTLAQNFADLYNATYGLQSVEVDPADSPFENPVGPTRRKPAGTLQGKD